MMTDRRHQRLEELFSQVVDLPDEERRRALGEACPDDADLRSEVEWLVAADRATTPERNAEGSVLPGVPRTVEGRAATAS